MAFRKGDLAECSTFWVDNYRASRPSSANTARGGGRQSPGLKSNFGATAASATVASAVSPGSPGRPRSARGTPKSRALPLLQAKPKVGEVVPGFMYQQVLDKARAERRQQEYPSAIVLVEMEYSAASDYLPGHGKGERYLHYFHELQGALSGRHVSIVKFHLEGPVVRDNKGVPLGELWDRYSCEERVPGASASNKSHLFSQPSRLGAFEVHLVQNCYEAAKVCSMSLGSSQASHAGPPEREDSIIMCSSCAAHHRGEPRKPETAFSKESLANQHTLLHSKLWTRRWPNVHSLKVSIGVIIMPCRPSVPPPVTQLIELEASCQVGLPSLPDLHMPEQQERSRAASPRYARLCQQREATLRHMQRAVDKYRSASDARFPEADEALTKYCKNLVKAVQGAKAPQGDSVADWVEAAHAAAKLDNYREAIWTQWKEDVSCWDDLQEVLEQRPDVQQAQRAAADKARCSEALRQEAEGTMQLIQAGPQKEGSLRGQLEDELRRLEESWRQEAAAYQKAAPSARRSKVAATSAVLAAEGPAAAGPAAAEAAPALGSAVLVASPPRDWEAACLQQGQHRLTASGAYRGYSADGGRLHNWACWCPADGQENRNQWLQVDLGHEQQVVGVATQGGESEGGHWCASFELKVSSDGTAWQDYGLVQGNRDASSVATNALNPPALARYVRFCPKDCGGSQGGWGKLRVEVYLPAATAPAPQAAQAPAGGSAAVVAVPPSKVHLPAATAPGAKAPSAKALAGGSAALVAVPPPEVYLPAAIAPAPQAPFGVLAALVAAPPSEVYLPVAKAPAPQAPFGALAASVAAPPSEALVES